MVVVVGSLNMDLTLEVAHFPQPGETVAGENFRSAHGGKGANQACALARMGVPVTLIGAVGADAFGDAMLAGLADDGVEVAPVLRRPDVASGTALITVEAHGQNQIVLAKGANDTLTPEAVLNALNGLTEVQALLLQLEIPVATAGAAIAWAQLARVPVILNPAPCLPLPESWLRQCAWIISNESETAQLTGLPVASPAEAGFAATELRRRAPASGLAITLGVAGAWLDCQDFTGHVPGFAVNAVDTVGAGDAWIGAFTAEWLAGRPVAEAARWAHLAAALAVTRRGAQDSLPTRAEVETEWRRRQG